MNEALAKKADLTALDAKADKTALAAKADKSAVDEALAKKADATALATKADTATVNEALAKKADLTALDAKADKTALAAKADKTAVNEALTKKADADASNIDVNAFSKKLGVGTITDGDTHLVTGDTVYQAIMDMPSGEGLVRREGDRITIGRSDKASQIDVSGKDGAARTITGVATDAKDVTSAANVGYVNASAQGVRNEIQDVRQSLTDDIKKVGAGAAALAGLHPQDYDPEDKWDFAVGYGNYRGQNASAVAAYYHPNEDTLINVGSTLGNGNNMVTAGVSFKFGPGGDTHTMSRTALTKELASVRAENQELRQELEAMKAELAHLAASVQQH